MLKAVAAKLAVVFVFLLVLVGCSTPGNGGDPDPDPTPTPLQIVDDMENGLPSGTEGDTETGIGWNTFSDGSPIGIETIAVGESDDLAKPNQSGSTMVLAATHTVGAFGGFTHAFENEAVDDWVTQDWSDFEGLSFWFYGNATDQTIQVDLFDNRGTDNSDSAERFFYRFADDTDGWMYVEVPFTEFQRRTDFQPGGAPDDGLNLTEVHGYAFIFPPDNGVERTNYIDDVAVYGSADDVDVPLQVRFDALSPVTEGDIATIAVSLTKEADETVTVDYALGASNATPDRDFIPTAAGQLVFQPGETMKTFSVVTIDNQKPEATERIVLTLTGVENAELGTPSRSVLEIADNDPVIPALVDDFEGSQPFAYTEGNVDLSATELTTGDALARPNQDTYEHVATAEYTGDVSFRTQYSEPSDWSGYNSLDFWYYGTGNGETVTFELLDNQPPVTDPARGEMTLVWSDEFNDPAGTPPNVDIWTHEVGDGTLNGIPGWGNDELQYYTDDLANAATDGNGNLVITTRATDPDTTLYCYYGRCEYTSARLITKDKIDFQYGRIEARVKVPSGGDGVDDGDGNDFGDGLWPAFWTLGNDIDEVGWPQTGEIDIMEVVTREPFEVFGTIHGPGYSGGNSYGDTETLNEPVSDDYHLFAIEWEPETIRWYVDDILYHTAEPGDVAPNEWVFEHPFFLLLNQAVGGNFGGPVEANTGFPQELLVDYVRVYQKPNASERFVYDFVDDTAGWQLINVPFGVDQPAPIPLQIVDDMENGLPSGSENGTGIGWNTFSDGSPISIETIAVGDSDDLARPNQSGSTMVLAATHTVGAFGGFTHAFANDTLDDWVTQDWSGFEGLGFWFYGNATNDMIQLDLLDNRGTDDSDSAERFFYRFADDTDGWMYVEIPFSEFQRRTDFQPGGAPDDGLTLTEVHGYAFIFPSDNGVERTNYIDDVAVYNTVSVTRNTEHTTGLTRSDDQPAGAPNDGLGLDQVWGYGFEMRGGGTVHIDRVILNR